VGVNWSLTPAVQHRPTVPCPMRLARGHMACRHPPRVVYKHTSEVVVTTFYTRCSCCWRLLGLGLLLLDKLPADRALSPAVYVRERFALKRASDPRRRLYCCGCGSGSRTYTTRTRLLSTPSVCSSFGHPLVAASGNETANTSTAFVGSLQLMFK